MSCLPTGASGTVFETNTGDDEAAVVAWLCPALPGEPVHPAAAPAMTTLSEANKTRWATVLPPRQPAAALRKAAVNVTEGPLHRPPGKR
ncbi:MAG TPA: hypothetical protein VMH35_02295 [Streptosporangiaceae bacterium]|nr:hypothetical protein [Streptosporangiaceae bacterium]